MKNCSICQNSKINPKHDLLINLDILNMILIFHCFIIFNYDHFNQFAV